MKRFFLLSLALAFFSCKKEDKTIKEEVPTERVSPQWSDFGLNGNVKSTTEYTSQEKKNGENTSSMRKFESVFAPDIALKFDQNGKLINKQIFSEKGYVAEDIVYDGKDKIISNKKFTSPTDFLETKYTWDDKNNTIITRRFNGNELLDKEVFVYEKGKKIEKHKYNSKEKLADKVGYTYDDNNRVLEEVYFRDKPVIQTRVSYEYDDHGNPSLVTHYDKDYNVISKTNSLYNYDNQLLSSQTFTADGNLEVEITRTYDNQKRLISKRIFEAFDKTNNKEEFDYDQNGNTTAWRVFLNDKLVNETIYKYDFNNNLIYQVVTNADRKETYVKSIEYTYDDNQNWISKKTTIGDLVLYTSRKIEYY